MINRLELLFRIIYERKMLIKNKQISTTKKERIKREREKRRHFKEDRVRTYEYFMELLLRKNIPVYST